MPVVLIGTCTRVHQCTTLMSLPIGGNQNVLTDSYAFDGDSYDIQRRFWPRLIGLPGMTGQDLRGLTW